MRIIPLKTGTIHCNKGWTITWRKDSGKMIDVPSVAWLIDSGDRKILVDTGMCDTERVNKHHYKGARQEPGQRIDEQLAKLGVKPEDISAVIFTHLHWDHCYNANLFTNAEFYVQKEELKFAKDPIPPYYGSYEFGIEGIVPPFSDLNFNLLEGDSEVFPGIRVIKTPGHSPGHQAVVVDTSKGKYVISGDGVMSYENLEGNKEKGWRFIPIGRHADIITSWKSMEKMEKEGDYILPGHDERVFEQEYYGD